MGTADRRPQDFAARAAQVFTPRTPITTKELFAGRWKELMTVVDAVNQAGLHVVVYGERGVGKTSLANVVAPTIYAMDDPDSDACSPKGRVVVKTVATTADSFSGVWAKLFRDISLVGSKPAAGFGPPRRDRVSLAEAYGLKTPLGVDDVRRVIATMPGSVFVIDEFDRMPTSATKEFTDLIKTLSDLSISATVVLVGVAETIDRLVADHKSIIRAISQIFLRRMRPEEIVAILQNGEKRLGVTFSEDAKRLIAHISQGLPHYTHLVGLHAVRLAADSGGRAIQRDTVFEALKIATEQAEQTTRVRHATAIHSAHREALYRPILLACAVAAARGQDPLGYFAPGSVVEPLRMILARGVEIATFNTHLNAFCQKERGAVLERDGQPRAFRFRFNDPMLVPFVFMDAVAKGVVSQERMAALLSD